MRLIDADALITIQTFNDETEEYGEEKMTIEQAIDRWSDEGCPPTIDAESVVRCFDCKYLQCNMRQDGILPLGVDEYECRHWCGCCDPMDFCSYGERREE